MSHRSLEPVFATAFLCLLTACSAPDPAEDPLIEVEASPEIVAPTGLQLTPIFWDEVPGWTDARLEPAIQAFRRQCALWRSRSVDTHLNVQAPWSGRISDWLPVCDVLSDTPAGDDPSGYRVMVEQAFTPLVVEARLEDDTLRSTGMLTGYYEPYVDVREQPDGVFSHPVRARPDDLISVNLGDFFEDLSGRRLNGRAENGRLVHYHERSEIEAGDHGEVLAWGRPIDVFFLQIQGSGRLVFENGDQIRAAFSAHNDLPYRSIGRELIRRGELRRHEASKQGIEAWLNEQSEDAVADLFAHNLRYVWFGLENIDDPQLGPRGAPGLALTPMASMAVDPAFHPYGLPIWLQADLPDFPDWNGLVIAQDTGGAIRGPLRGDFFWGWGETEERRAGTTRSDARWIILLPQPLAQQVLDSIPPA